MFRATSYYYFLCYVHGSITYVMSVGMGRKRGGGFLDGKGLEFGLGVTWILLLVAPRGNSDVAHSVRRSSFYYHYRWLSRGNLFAIRLFYLFYDPFSFCSCDSFWVHRLIIIELRFSQVIVLLFAVLNVIGILPEMSPFLSVNGVRF